jgi:hypothetical protein
MARSYECSQQAKRLTTHHEQTQLLHKRIFQTNSTMAGPSLQRRLALESFCHMQQCGHLSDEISERYVTNFSHCTGHFASQLSKWTHWNSQLCSKLEAAPHVHGSRPSGSIQLIADKRDGEGPETIIFENLPEGWYQVLVHKHRNDEPLSMRRSDASVRFVLPAMERDVSIRCVMEPSCQSDLRFWRAALIEVRQQTLDERIIVLHAGPKHWQTRNVTLDTLPTSSRPHAIARLRTLPAGSDQWGERLAPSQIHVDEPVRPFHHRMGHAYFNATCTSQCVFEDDRDKNQFSPCLSSA